MSHKRRNVFDPQRPPRALPSALDLRWYEDEWKAYCVELTKLLSMHALPADKPNTQSSPEPIVHVFHPELLDKYAAGDRA